MFTPTINDVPMACINQAAITYHVPAILIISVLKTEGGRNGTIHRNRNGSYDLGVMQINTRWLPTLAQFGISAEAVRYNPCSNVNVGAWILAGSIAGSNEMWRGVGDYNSHTSIYNQRYSQKVQNWHRRLQATLE